MTAAFYIAGAVALASTLMAITRTRVVHALLYFIISLFSVSIMFFIVGAPFAAALEVIIYAGAIMVLFLFVIMILNLGAEAARQEKLWLTPGIWLGPSILALILIADLAFLISRGPVPGGPSEGILQGAPTVSIPPKDVGIALYGPYLLGVELASLLLLAGLIGALHLGRRGAPEEEEDGSGIY